MRAWRRWRPPLIYGEVEYFGEVATIAASCRRLSATWRGHGVGTFNDRFRDAIRGGGYSIRVTHRQPRFRERPVHRTND
jgi:hypothetical protein